jgi:LysR family transcriptional regulator for metE and metH
MLFVHTMIPNPSLETRDLRVVHAIAEAGSVTRAAHLLHVSQSAVSHQLGALERRLGVPMFEREGRKLRITAAGERVVQLSREILAPLAQAEIEIKRSSGVKRPKLRVATQCFTAYHWLPQVLAALSASHPEVDLYLASHTSGNIGNALEESELDLALCVMPPQGGGYARRKLFDDELVLAVPRGHRLSKKKWVVGSDLGSETLIQSDVDPTQRELIRNKIFAKGEGFARVVRVPVTEAIFDLVQAGAGVGILASFVLRQRVQRGELDTVRITPRGLRRTWTAVYRRASPLSSPIETLISTIERDGNAAR